jgi:hypothetical protein
MNKPQFLKALKRYAEDYRPGAADSVHRNHHMNEVTADEEIDQRVVDALLVDFINFTAMKLNMDHGLYTKDFDPSDSEIEEEPRVPFRREP